MACFVEGKIDPMKETAAGIIGCHGGENEFPSPYKNDQGNNHPAAKVKNIHLRLNKKENVSKKRGDASILPVSFAVTSPFLKLRTRVFGIF